MATPNLRVTKRRSIVAAVAFERGSRRRETVLRISQEQAIVRRAEQHGGFMCQDGGSSWRAQIQPAACGAGQVVKAAGDRL